MAPSAPSKEMIDNRRGENARCIAPPGNPTPVGPAVSSRGTTALPDAQIQRRVIVVLAAAQAFSGFGIGTAAAVSPVAAATMSGSTVIGGAAATAMVLGAAASSLLIARIAEWAGRRPALTLGYLLGGAGAVGAALGSALGSWPLMLAALLPFGAGSAAGLAARFAATDLAPAGRKARALGVVMWATTVGAVAGPALGGPAAHAAHAAQWAAASGPLVLSAVALGLAAVVVGTWLRPDPLLLARTKVTESGGRATAATVSRQALWASPRARLGVSGIGLTQLVMVGLMSMTPVHMTHVGSSLNVVGLVISMHMAGMFALAPVFGWLADRVGSVRVLAIGLLLLVVGGLVAAVADGHQASLLAVAMATLGLGWSAALVAGSSLVVEAVASAQRTTVQGWVDVAMSLSGAAGGIVAGLALTRTSYGVLAGAAAVLVLPLLAAVFVPAAGISRNGTDTAGKTLPGRRPSRGQDTAMPRRARDRSAQLCRPRVAMGALSPPRDAPAATASSRPVGSWGAGCPAAAVS